MSFIFDKRDAVPAYGFAFGQMSFPGMSGFLTGRGHDSGKPQPQVEDEGLPWWKSLDRMLDPISDAIIDEATRRMPFGEYIADGLHELGDMIPGLGDD